MWPIGLRKTDPPWLGELIRLIDILNAIEPLHKDAIKSLRQAHLYRTMLEADADGKPWGTDGGPDFVTLYADNPSVQAEYIDDPKKQIAAASKSLIYYLSTGETLSAILAMNISTNIRKARRTDVEHAFLQAYNRHFASEIGTVDKALLDRMKELEAVHGREKTSSIPAPPPPDLELSALQSAIPKLRMRILDRTDQGGGRYFFNFEFHCTECGGYIITTPDDKDPDGDVTCKACGIRLGRYGDVLALGSYLGKQELARLGL